MQQGNLLNSLLNLNPASVGGKSTAKSRQPEVSPEQRQDFQAAMAQARPDQARANTRESRPGATVDQSGQPHKKPHHETATEKTAVRPLKAERPISAARAEKSDTDTPQVSTVENTTESQAIEGQAADAQTGDTQSQEGTVQSVATSLQPEVMDETHPLLSVGLVDNRVVGESDQANLEGSTEMLVNINTGLITGEERIDGESASGLLAAHGMASAPVDPTAALTDVVGSTLQNISLVSSPKAFHTEAIPELLQGGQGKNLTGSGEVSPLQILQPGLRANPAMGETSGYGTADQNLVLSDNSLADSSGMDADAQDTSAGILNLKQSLQNPLQKSADMLSASQDKNLLADSAKSQPPTAASLIDAPARLPDNSLSSTRSFMARIHLPQTMGQPQWNQAVGERVLWMAAQNLTAADIRLDPPDLGSMHVKVTLQQDQASVSFVSPNPAVREALDQQATRLREMFAEQGLNLVNVDVSDRHAHERQSADEDESGSRRVNQDDDQGLQVIGQSNPLSLHLVDHYA